MKVRAAIVNPAFPIRKVCQFGELDIQRSLFFALFGCLAGHFSDFSGIAHLIHTHDTVSVGYRCSSHDGIRRVSGFFVEVSFIHCLVDHQLSGQARFVDLQGNRFQQCSVGRDFLTRSPTTMSFRGISCIFPLRMTVTGVSSPTAFSRSNFLLASYSK